MPVVDLVDVMSVAREVRLRARLAEPPYSTQALMAASYPLVTVTGEELPPVVFEVVLRTETGPLIVYNRNVNNDARRVGIAHALGHIEFDGTSERKCTSTVGTVRRVEFEEHRADIFAGELLCPLGDLDHYFRTVSNLFPRRATDKANLADMVDRAGSLFKVPAGFVRWRMYQLAYLRKISFHTDSEQ